MCAAAAVQHNARTHTPDAHTLQTPKHRSHNQTMDGGVADTAVSPSPTATLPYFGYAGR